jgi:hypothetical protein
MYICSIMKRGLSIFFLCILMAAAIQPTFAFHFCGGSFHSAHIGGAPRSCCEGEMDEEAADFAAGAEPAFAVPQVPCCSNYTVEIATDTYQAPAAFSLVVAAPIVFLPAILSVADTACLPICLLQTIFPPGSPTHHTSDLLALFCILRI